MAFCFGSQGEAVTVETCLPAELPASHLKLLISDTQRDAHDAHHGHLPHAGWKTKAQEELILLSIPFLKIKKRSVTRHGMQIWGDENTSAQA